MTRLKEKYQKEVVPALQKEFGYKNVMAVPRIEKVVVNMGLGEATANAKLIDTGADEVARITGQKPVTRHAKIEAGSTVLVIGCGGVGLNAVQGAMLSGASKIIAADILDNKLEMAKTFGATHTINTAKDNDAAKKVKEMAGGLGVDYAFDAVSNYKTQALAFDALAPGGHAVTT